MTIFDKTDQYEIKLFTFIDKYRSFYYTVRKYIYLSVIFIGKIFEFLFFNIARAFNYTQKALRYTTFPIHWLWLQAHLRKSKETDLFDERVFEIGAHYIYGKPKAGKSTFMYHIMQDYAEKTGKSSMTTQPMELPRTDIYGRKYYHHQLFHPSDIFIKGKQEYAFNTKHFNVVVFEEMLQEYHQRNNKTNAHNDEVLPLVASMGAQRHQGEGIDLFFFISQLAGNDISIMQMLKGYHIPKIKKVFDYKHWLDTGKFRFRIKGWRVTSYHIQAEGRGNYKLTNPYKWFYKFTREEDFKYFNRFNLSQHFADLPILKGREM